uniref:Tissue factor pathway inhibitor n=1 Tax=Rhipicephalus zambeziensis TaxID=60191 RepID=A0A224YRU2_9ACAR
MGLLFRCHALAMCIAIVSGFNGNDIPSENGESGLSTNHGGNIGSNIGNEISNGSLRFLPGKIPGYGNSAASGAIPPKCMKPPKKGMCKAFMLMWFFDYEHKYCKMFVYGGCGGNANQFASEKKCQHECLPRKREKLVCSLAPKITKSKCYFRRRWVFDEQKGTCYQLAAHKCSRNANGFKRCQECMERCSILNKEAVCSSARGPNSAPREQEQGNTTRTANSPKPGNRAE